MRVLVGDVPAEVEVHGGEVRVVLAGSTYLFRCERERGGVLLVDGVRAWVEGGRVGIGGDSAPVRRVATGAAASSAALTPPMPATVLRVNVNVGDLVGAGQPLLVLGAMKTELVLRAPAPSVVRAIHTRAGAAVVPGERLLDLEPVDPKA